MIERILNSRETVNSVGLTPRRMPLTQSNPAVKIYRHAVSLDEHRAKFKSVHWHPPNFNDEEGPGRRERKKERVKRCVYSGFGDFP